MRPEQSADRVDHLMTRRADDDDIAAGGAVPGHK